MAILRVEQLYPFPKEALAEALAPYRNAEVVWCQEEPENMGAWTFVDRRIEARAAGRSTSRRSGRTMPGASEAASPATGLAKVHAAAAGKPGAARRSACSPGAGDAAADGRRKREGEGRWRTG